MRIVRYTAVDAEGRAVEGTIEADDWASANATLRARGWTQCREIEATAKPPTIPPLSRADAVQLASYVSQLANAGLPLAGGLRAAARDAGRRSLAAALDALSDRLESGHDLVAALEPLHDRLPRHVRAMVETGARSGRLAESLDALLAHERDADDLTHRFWQAVTYPALVMTLLVAWLLMITLWVIPSMQANELEEDWIGEVLSNGREISDQVTPAVRLAEFARVTPRYLLALAGLLALVVGGARVLGGRAAVSRLLAEVPLIGAAWRDRGLADFSGLLAAFVDQQVPLHEALQLTASAARDPAIAAASARAADDVASGTSLAKSLGRGTSFPPTLRNFVAWGSDHGALADSLRTARRMFEDRFTLQVQLMRMILPTIAFLIVASSILVVGRLVIGLLQIVSELVFTFSPARVPGWGTATAYIQLSGVASLLVASITLWLAAQVLRSAADPGDAIRGLLRFTSLVLMSIALLGTCMIVMGGAGFIAWLVASAVWLRAAVHYRALQKRELLEALALAAGHRMPLAPMAMAVADEQEGSFTARVRDLAQWLANGAELSDIEADRLLPREATLAVQVGTETGDLAGALDAAKMSQVFDRTLLRPVMVRLLYLFPIVLVFDWWMKFAVLPSYIKIFQDFDIRLPSVSVLTFGASGATEGYPTGWWPMIFYTSPTGGPFARLSLAYVLLMSLVLLLAVLTWLQWRGMRWIRLPGVSRVIDWVDAGPVLRVLALAVEHGRPMNRGVALLARYHPKRSVRARLAAALRRMDDGVAWQEALRGRRLIGAADAAVLSAAQRNGNVEWALGELADSLERRANHRLQAVAQVALPLMVLPVAALVGLLAVAYFLPLVELIKALS